MSVPGRVQEGVPRNSKAVPSAGRHTNSGSGSGSGSDSGSTAAVRPLSAALDERPALNHFKRRQQRTTEAGNHGTTGLVLRLRRGTAEPAQRLLPGTKNSELAYPSVQDQYVKSHSELRSCMELFAGAMPNDFLTPTFFHCAAMPRLSRHHTDLHLVKEMLKIAPELVAVRDRKGRDAAELAAKRHIDDGAMLDHHAEIIAHIAIRCREHTFRKHSCGHSG